VPDILTILASGEVNLPAAIVMRHAERPAILANNGHYTTGLTEKGLEDAFIFGSGLSEYSESFKLYYSPVKRCLQTAEKIQEALLKAGKNAKLCGPEEKIGVSYMLVDIDSAFSEAMVHGDEFIRTWFDGGLRPGVYKPLDDTLAEHLDYLKNCLDSTPEMSIHVTHDWNLNVLREGIFHLRHEDVGWPGFLSGLVFSKDNDIIHAMIKKNGETIIAAIPL